MNKERLQTEQDLMEWLMGREVFSWPEEGKSTIREIIFQNASQEAKEKITTLNQEIRLSPQVVIEKFKPRAESWQFGELLDHIKLKREQRLSSFWN